MPAIECQSVKKNVNFCEFSEVCKRIMVLHKMCRGKVLILCHPDIDFLARFGCYTEINFIKYHAAQQTARWQMLDGRILIKTSKCSC